MTPARWSAKFREWETILHSLPEVFEGQANQAEVIEFYHKFEWAGQDRLGLVTYRYKTWIKTTQKCAIGTKKEKVEGVNQSTYNSPKCQYYGS